LISWRIKALDKAPPCRLLSANGTLLVDE